MAAVLGMACRAQNAPARNPLAETNTAVASVTGTAVPLPTVTAPPRTGTPTAPPGPGEVEPAVARATSLLAGWLAVPQRDFSVVRAEAVTWPNACLGVEHAGVACAAVITPGFQVVLRDPLGAVHTVHLDATAGSARWAGEQRARGRITGLDRTTQQLTVEAMGGPLVLRAVPGTLWVPDLAGASALGAEVMVGYDPPAGASTAAGVAAWVTLTE